MEYFGITRHMSHACCNMAVGHGARKTDPVVTLYLLTWCRSFAHDMLGDLGGPGGAGGTTSLHPV